MKFGLQLSISTGGGGGPCCFPGGSVSAKPFSTPTKIYIRLISEQKQSITYFISIKK